MAPGAKAISPVALVILGLQLFFDLIALHYLPYVKQYGRDVEFTWQGVMLPLALLACHGMAFGSIYRFGRSDKNAVTGPLVLCLVPIVVMASWWALLLSVGELGWTEYPAYWS